MIHNVANRRLAPHSPCYLYSMRVYAVSGNRSGGDEDDGGSLSPRSAAWHERAPRDIVMASWLLFGTSLCLPALELSNGSPYWGISLLFIGWLGLTAGSLAWLANPLLGLANYKLLQHRVRPACFISLLAGSVAGTTTFLSSVLLDGTGTMATVTGFGLGFYLWIGSCFVTALGSSVLWIRSMRQDRVASQEAKPHRPTSLAA